MDDLQFYKQIYEEKSDLLRAVTDRFYEVRDERDRLKDQEKQYKTIIHQQQKKIQELDSILMNAIEIVNNIEGEWK